MKCPMCKSDSSKIITSRSKLYNKVTKEFKGLPDTMNDFSDYRMRRHRCNKCGYLFDTIELYFNAEDFNNIENEKSIVCIK